MSTQHDDGWRLSDAMWARMAPLIPPPKPHPLGCHRPRISDRVAMNAILRLLRTDMQWGSARCHRVVFALLGAPAVSRVDRRGRVRALLARRTAGMRGTGEDRLGLAGARRDDDQGPVGRGKKSGPTLPTAANGASSAACSLMDTACRWHWSSRAPIGMTACCWKRPWPRSSSTSRRRRRARGCAWIWAMSVVVCATMSGRSAWCRGFVAVGTNARQSAKVRGHVAGSSNDRIAGSIAIDACSFAGKSVPTRISQCCTLRVV